MLSESELQRRLDAFIAATPCPGASLGIVADGQTITVASGLLNTGTGYPATPDSLFQIGSVTKVWTATLVMQLVDEGLVELDAPVKRYLPDFALADADRADAVTIRHLLTHTSGIEGDVFDDVGENGDALERYVAAMADIGTVHDLEETWSYCNSGFVALGRLIEVVRETSWEAAVQTHLAEPLGMAAVATRAGQAILHRVAVGHRPDPETGEVSVVPVWSLPQALAPAGLVTCSVGDLLAFARLHLDGGRGPDGTQLLSPATVEAMRTPQAACPEVDLLADQWGLGFWVKQWGADRVIGHGGNTIGQSAYFDMLPDEGVAVALLTNVSGAALEATTLVKDLLRDLAGVDAPAYPYVTLPETPAEIDLTPYVGRYSRYGGGLRGLGGRGSPVDADDPRCLRGVDGRGTRDDAAARRGRRPLRRGPQGRPEDPGPADAGPLLRRPPGQPVHAHGWPGQPARLIRVETGGRLSRPAGPSCRGSGSRGGPARP
jgi:CubicO group peptidase (beta-lactamase class C family)